MMMIRSLVFYISAIREIWWEVGGLATSEQVPTSSLPLLRSGPLPLTWPRVATPSTYLPPNFPYSTIKSDGMYIFLKKYSD